MNDIRVGRIAVFDQPDVKADEVEIQKEENRVNDHPEPLAHCHNSDNPLRLDSEFVSRVIFAKTSKHRDYAEDEVETDDDYHR